MAVLPRELLGGALRPDRAAGHIGHPVAERLHLGRDRGIGEEAGTVSARIDGRVLEARRRGGDGVITRTGRQADDQRDRGQARGETGHCAN